MSLLELKKDLIDVLRLDCIELMFPSYVDFRQEAEGHQNMKDCVLIDAKLEEEALKGHRAWEGAIGIQLRISADDWTEHEFRVMTDILEAVLMNLDISTLRKNKKYYAYLVSLKDRDNIGIADGYFVTTWRMRFVVQF